MVVFVPIKKVIHRKSGSSFRKVIGAILGGFVKVVKVFGARRRPAFFQKGALSLPGEYYDRGFLAEFCAGSGLRGAAPGVTCFGDTTAMQTALCELVLSGVKRATASLAMWHEVMPRAGDLSIMVDGEGVPRGVIETTEVFEGAFADVDAGFAADEGEGDGSVEYWKAEHRRYFTGEMLKDGGVFSEAVVVVFERFRLVWVPN